MKKIMMMSVLACISMASFAQLSWNAKVGMNVSDLYGKGTDGSEPKFGYKVGVGAEYAFTDLLSIQPSLFFSTKGAEYSESIYNASASVKLNEMYLELPVNAQVRIDVSPRVNLIIAAGPYFAVGVGGKTTLNATFAGEHGSVEMDTFGKDRLNRFDFGLGICYGIEIGRILVEVDGQLGFVKLSGEGVEAPKNLNTSITLGYKF